MQPSKLIKISVLGLSLFGLSLLLSQLILDFVAQGNVFLIDLTRALSITGAMLAIAITQALTIGAWNTNAQYLLIPLPLTAGMLLAILGLPSLTVVIIFLVAFVLILYSVYDANVTLKSMLRYNPSLIFRYSTKGIFFAFSALAGVMMYLNAPADALDVGKKLSEIIAQPVQKIVDEQLSSLTNSLVGNAGNLGGMPELDSKALEGVLRDMGLGNAGIGSAKEAGLNIKDLLEKQVNAFIEPYKTFVKPILALLTFLLFEFLASVAYTVFALIIRPIFFFTKKMGFFKVETALVEQEQLHF